jgi:hypothetical protein
MSEHVVHTAILEDCFNLALISNRVCEEFKEIVKNHRSFAQIGSVTISGDKFSFKLLEEYKKRWRDRKPEELIEAKLAFVLGWISHRAADRQMKPIWRLGPIKELESKIGLKPTDCSIYHEACIFREYFMENSVYKYAVMEEELLKNPASAGVYTEGMMDFIHSLVKKSLIEMHTFKPDYDDVDGWLERIFERQQCFYVDLKRYAKAIIEPDPDKWKTYITDINFFDSTDPVIVIAKRLRKDDKVSNEELDTALAATNRSHYAQALIKAYKYVLTASDFFINEMTTEELMEKFDIGRMGPDGIVV